MKVIDLLENEDDLSDMEGDYEAYGKGEELYTIVIMHKGRLWQADEEGHGYHMAPAYVVNKADLRRFKFESPDDVDSTTVSHKNRFVNALEKGKVGKKASSMKIAHHGKYQPKNDVYLIHPEFG